MDAVERLNRFKEEFKIRERKQELYSGIKTSTYRLRTHLDAGIHRASQPTVVTREVQGGGEESYLGVHEDGKDGSRICEPA